ncbi:MAG: hypothetical protein A2017_04555 [Lentisphaerae bacterium GWF2_44_16]|nr:MAG: hypothetical protein A2017_04555 [Lentisphaerae bacterium GWF2_44_16]
MSEKMDWFVNARFGLFVHYGLYSLIGRGEWAMNRERISSGEYRKLAEKFTAEKFDADAVCSLAAENGMKYITFTTMHHDGFRLYDTELSDFNSMKSPAKRDLVAEIVAAARKKGLKVALYHSLNNWTDKPDGADAIDNPADYEKFIRSTHTRIKELVTRFNPIDVLWYDGWWPFHADGWQATAMNDMVKEIQPHIIFNGRNGLPGDFSTPEGHMSAPSPWRPWEACMTLNNHWGYHHGDHEWKSPAEVIGLLAKAASGKGNLLINIGPRGDGSIPEESVNILNQTGKWLKKYGECVNDTDIFAFDLQERGEHRGDWSHNGIFTAKGNFLYHLIRYWPGAELILSGLQCKVLKAVLLGEKNQDLPFTQKDDKLTITELPERAPGLCPVIRLECDSKPALYLTGGMRVPEKAHPNYDPCSSDIAL